MAIKKIRIRPEGGNSYADVLHPETSVDMVVGLDTALASKLNSSLKGANSGLAELDATGKIPSSQLPSYVDDVLEYATKAGFPATGETGKIYIDLATNLTYRWSGSAYVEISPSLALGETSSTAYRGDRGKVAYDHSQIVHARTDATFVENSVTNGNIKINGAEQVVYTHPTGTNPHGTTKADVGLGNVSNALQATKAEFDTHVTDFNNKYGLLTNIVTTTGTSTAYVATVPNYVAGKQFPLKFHIASGSSPTLNVNSTGAKAINKAGGSPANFKAGIYNLIYDGTSFQLLGEGGEYGTAQAQHVLVGQTIGTDEGLVTGTIPIRGYDYVTDADFEMSSQEVIVRPPEGYWDGLSPLSYINEAIHQDNIKKGVIIGGMRGTFTEDSTAVPNDVLNGEVFYGNGSRMVGTMPNNMPGSDTITTQNGTYTIPPGRHYGTGTVTANITNLVAGNVKSGINVGGVVGSFTSDANAVAGNILQGKTAYVAGSKITGTMYSNTPGTTTLTTQGEKFMIPEGYHYGAGDVRTNITNLVAGNVKSGVSVGGVAGTFTSDANAVASDITSGKTAYVNGNKITGTSTKQYGSGDTVFIDYPIMEFINLSTQSVYRQWAIRGSKIAIYGKTYDISNPLSPTLLAPTHSFDENGYGTGIAGNYLISLSYYYKIQQRSMDCNLLTASSDNFYNITTDNDFVYAVNTSSNIVKRSLNGATTYWTYTTGVSDSSKVSKLYTHDYLDSVYVVVDGVKLVKILKSNGTATTLTLKNAYTSYKANIGFVDPNTKEVYVLLSNPRMIKVNGTLTSEIWNTAGNLAYNDRVLFTGSYVFNFLYSATDRASVVYRNASNGLLQYEKQFSGKYHELESFDPSDPYRYLCNKYDDGLAYILRGYVKL